MVDTAGASDLLRRARSDESEALANLWLRSRRASIPANPPPVHDDDDVRRHFATVVMARHEVWLADRPGTGVVGLMTLMGEWVEHLHVEPELTGTGIGSRLIELAKQLRPSGLELWTFQSNLGARRFYERHGFVALETTEGDNEEGAPDVRYRWTP